MGKMSNVLEALCQRSQDTHGPLQHPDVEAPQRPRRKRNSSQSECSDEDNGDDERRADERRNKTRKVDRQTIQDSSDREDDHDQISVHADDDDNVSVLLGGNTTEDNTSSVSSDDTLKSLGEIYVEAEPTCSDIKPQLATIVEKRWHKKACFRKINITSGQIQKTCQLSSSLFHDGKP